MIGRHFSLILLPTNKCNVACEYCFEDKTNDFMSHEQLSIVIEKLLDHMERKAIASMTIYWQGGEIMLLPPAWFERAHELIQKAADARGKRIAHSLQSNMIGYTPRWNTIIAEMFGNSVGTSMDFPNLYRKARHGTPAQYTALWSRNVRTARQAGIQVGVIAIPNKGTLQVGAERFYTYFVDELGITDFQINTSFSGGELNDAKRESILDMDGLSQFCVDLATVWVERGYEQGVKLGPLDQLMRHFTGEGACLPCIWLQNCTDEFVSIDARGHVAQCDCWVTSYPDYWFGNIFDDVSFTELMQKESGTTAVSGQAGGADATRELCRVRLPVDLPRRVSGADVCHYGGLLREGSVLQGLQGPLLHHGSAWRRGWHQSGIGVLCRYCKGTIESA